MTDQRSQDLDLVVLVPGNDDREAIHGLLSQRGKSLGIRSVCHEILVHPRRDPGCFAEAPDFLRIYQRRAEHALVLFDHEGCGQEQRRSCSEVQADLERRLASSGWRDRAQVVVVSPELEVWVWGDSSAVEEALGWRGQWPRLRDWLLDRHCWPAGQSKPSRPKECLEAALREVRMPRSSALFKRLAGRVEFEGCSDTSFLRLKEILRRWFS